MVNRQRFLLDDLDSEGFPLRYGTMHANQIEDERINVAIAAINLGKTLDHAVPQAMLADHKCMRCANPLGWQEVDGVVLPRITWADDVRPVPADVQKAAYRSIVKHASDCPHLTECGMGVRECGCAAMGQ